uniref:Uncharacterized protein n=1 Tax=Gossypium raimondii TaxID=29730 RepID=A0A0D2QFS9_GOSRA|nr:hypothetical protein B456_001G185600 [Gossypium raimondii]
MGKTPTGSKELARELLIAISSFVPDTDLNAEHASKNIDATNGAAVTKTDGAEKYRSELILKLDFEELILLKLERGKFECYLTCTAQISCFRKNEDAQSSAVEDWRWRWIRGGGPVEVFELG